MLVRVTAMKKKGVIAIGIFLLLCLSIIVGNHLYNKDNCEYQTGKIIATAHLDPEQCKDKGKRLVRVLIFNDSHYDLSEYKFFLKIFKNNHSRAERSLSYDNHRIIPKRDGISGCFPVPNVEGLKIENIKKDYYFKLDLYHLEFDKGNKNRLICSN